MLLTPMLVISGDSVDDEIRAHVDSQLASVDLDLCPAQLDALRADRLTFNLVALVPGLASYVIDTHIFGGIGPMGYIFDWLVGGAVPLSLALIAPWQTGDVQSAFWVGALGLYVIMRAAIVVTINDHVTVYNEHLDQRLAEHRSKGGSR